MKSYEDVIKELDSKIPRDVISQRSGGNGRMLSYLEGHYVIDRLNKTLGQGRWGYESQVTLLHSGEVEDKHGNIIQTVHYSARVTLKADLPGGNPGGNLAYFTDYGYGDGTDKINVGKAHELAIKESITDGLKRCAKNLGMSMGLALYSKEQENVSDDIPEAEVKPEVRSSEVRTKSTLPTVELSKAAEVSPEPADKGKLTELIARYIKIARAQKKSEVTKAYFLNLGVSTPDELTKLDLEQLQTSKKYLEDLTK